MFLALLVTRDPSQGSRDVDRHPQDPWKSSCANTPLMARGHREQFLIAARILRVSGSRARRLAAKCPSHLVPNVTGVIKPRKWLEFRSVNVAGQSFPSSNLWFRPRIRDVVEVYRNSGVNIFFVHSSLRGRRRTSARQRRGCVAAGIALARYRTAELNALFSGPDGPTARW